EGIVVPPAGRFMGRDLDFCLNIFDYRTTTEAEIRARCQLAPSVIAHSDAHTEEALVGPAHTGCFVVGRLRCEASTTVPKVARLQLLLIPQGKGTLRCGDHVVPLQPASRFILPAGGPACVLEPTPGGSLDAVVCQPGARRAQA